MGKKAKKKKEQALEHAPVSVKPKAKLQDGDGVNRMLWIQALIIFAFAFAIYANTLGHQYAVDDTIVILKNTLTKQGFAGIPELMTTDAFYGFFGEDYKFVAGGRYRPLSIVTFAIEYELFGMNPFVSHLGNIILYGLTGILLFFLLHLLFKPKLSKDFRFSLPLLATLIYIAHPLHTEAVANIKGRDEIMGLLGSLGTLYLAIKFVRSGEIKFLAGMIVVFILSLLSKENAITFVAVIPLAIYYFTDVEIKRYIPVVGSLGVIAAIYMVMRQSFTDVSLTAETQEILNDPFVYATYGEQLATVFKTLGLYLKLLLIPYPQSHDYYFNQIPIIGWSNWQAILPLLIYIGLGAYALMTIKQKHPLSFAIFYFILTLSVVSNIVLPVGTTMSERFLYMPSVGYALAIPVLLMHAEVKISLLKKLDYSKLLPSKPQIILVVSVSMIVIYGLLTILRNPAWENDFVLFTTDVETSTNSAKLQNAAGGTLVDAADNTDNPTLRQQYLQEAIEHLNKAIEIYPNYLNAYLLLGNAYYKLDKNTDRAKPYYEQTLKLKPSYFEGNFNLGTVLLQDGKPAEGLQYLKKACKRRPNSFEARYNLADCFQQMNMPDSAIYHFNICLQMNPNADNAYYKIGVCYGRLKNDLDNSIKYLQQAININPNVPTYYEDLGVAYGLKGDLQNAANTFSQLIQVRPQSAKAHFNLGITYMQMGDTTRAMQFFQEANRLNPGQYPMP